MCTLATMAGDPLYRRGPVTGATLPVMSERLTSDLYQRHAALPTTAVSLNVGTAPPHPSGSGPCCREEWGGHGGGQSPALL